MILNRLLKWTSLESRVTGEIEGHLRLLAETCRVFQRALETGDRSRMQCITDFERQADDLRREIITRISEGAFLPYLRANLCKFVEMVDYVFDFIAESATCYLETDLPPVVREDCIRVAFLNVRIAEMLLLTFQSMVGGKSLREKTLAIRIYEKKIDDLGAGIFRRVREVPIKDFWEGKLISDFIAALTQVSNIIEDASDSLQVIHVSMR
jgi:predicted phosphate transport protein (TIGR00153 family)